MNLTNECCIRLTPIGFDADYLSEGISTTADDRATPSEMPDSAAISYAVGATNTTASTVVTENDAHLTASTTQTTAPPLSPQTSAMLSATPTGSYASHTLLGQAEAQNHYHTQDALVDKESDVTGVHLCSPMAYTPSILTNGGMTANTPAKSTSGTYTANGNSNSGSGANNYAYNIPSPQTLYQSHFGGASVLPTAVSSTSTTNNNNNTLSKANSTHTLTATTTVGSPFFASVTSANKSAWPSAMSRSVSTASLSDTTNNNHHHHHLGPTAASSYGVTTAMQSASNAPGSMTTLPTPVFTPTNNVVASFATPTTTTTMTALFTQSPNATANNTTTIVVPQGLGSTAHVPMPPTLVTSVPTLASAGMPKFSSNPFAAVAGSGAGLSSLHPKSPSPPCAPLSIGATNTTGTKANTDAHTNNTSSMPVSQPHALSPSPPPPPPPLPQPPTPLTGTVSPTQQHNEDTTTTMNDTNTTTTAARSCPVISGTGWTSLTPTPPPPPPPPTIGSTAVNETNGHTLQPGNYLTARRASDASLLYSPIRPVDNYVTNRSTTMQDGTYGPQVSSFGRGGLACPSSHSRLTSPNSSREASFYGSNGSFALPEPTTTTANTTSNGVASSSAMHAGFAQAEGGGNNRESLRVPGPRNTNTTTTAASGWSYVTQGSNGTSESALPASSPPPLLRRFATQPATTTQESAPHAEGNTATTNMPGSKQQEGEDDEDYTALYSPFTDNVFSTTVADDDDEAALPPPPPLPVQQQQEHNNDEATHMGLPHAHSLPSSSTHYHDPQGLLASQPADSSCAELDELTAMPSMQSVGHDESPVTRTETRTGETLVPVYDPDFKDLLAIPTSQIFHRPHPCFGVSRLVLCRNFVLEKGAESCGKGARCKFVHADTTNVTRSSIHVNYAWRSLELCTYARLPSGDMLRVLAPNERQPSEWIPSERVLVTRGSVNWRQHSSPLSHCAHYYFNRMCNRGERCNFIHAVYVDPNVQGDFKRAPAPVAVASAGMVKHGHNSNNNNGSSTRSVSITTSMHEGHASLHNGGPFMVSAGPSAMTTPRMGPDMLRPNHTQTQQPQLFTPVPAMAMMMMPAPVPRAALLTPQGSRAHNASGAGIEGPEAQMIIRSTLSSPLAPPIQSPTPSLTPFGTSATGATLLQGAMMTTSHAIPLCAPQHTTSAGPTLSPGALLSPMGHMHAALSMPPSPNFLPPQQQQQRLSGSYTELGVQPRSAPSGPFTMMVMSPLSATPLQAQTPRSTSPMLGQGNTTTTAGPFAARSSSENNIVPSNHIVTNNHFMQSYRTEPTDARLSPFSPSAAPSGTNSRNTTPPQATHITAQPAPPLPFEPTLSELSRDYDGLLFSPHIHNNNNGNSHGMEGKDTVTSAVTNGTAAMTAKVAGSSDTMTGDKVQDFGSIGPAPQDHANTTPSTTITSTTMTGSQAKSSGITVPTALYSDAIWSDLPDTFATQEDNEDVIGLESLLDLSEDKKCIES